MSDDEPSTDPQSEALAKLSDDLTKERERRREERFLWILLFLIVLDVCVLRDASNSTIPIVILVLELIGMTVIAKRLGISSAVVALDKAASIVGHEIK